MLSRGDRFTLFGIVVGVALVLVVLWAISPLLVGWPLCLYVLWRAWPGIRTDFARLRWRVFPAREWRI